MYNSGFYRVIDPLENFKIRLTVREISRLTSQSEKDAYVPFHTEQIISWQEKIHGPVDVADYIQHVKDPQKGGTPSQRESRRELEKIHEKILKEAKGKEKNADHSKSLLRPVMIHTYISRDHINPYKSSILHENATMESYVGAALNSNIGDEKSSLVESREQSHIVGGISSFRSLRGSKVYKRLNGGISSKTMHICLATDVNIENLSGNTHIWDPRAQYNEDIICSLTLHQDGLLETTPAFSTILEETGSSSVAGHSSSATQNLFMDNVTVAAGVRQGFRLESFRLETKNGAEFEFTIENLNEVTVPADIEELRNQIFVIDKQLAQRSREIVTEDISANWKQVFYSDFL